MARFFFVLVLLCYAQNGIGQVLELNSKPTQAEEIKIKAKVDYEYFNKSKSDNAEFQNKILENAVLKESTVNEFKEQDLDQQINQKSIIDSKNESQKTMPEAVKPAVVESGNESKETIGEVLNNEVKKNKSTQRLFGPSQFDSRIEPLQLNPQIAWQNQLLNSSLSVGMIVERERLTSISSELFQLDISTTLGEKFNLCTQEAFRTQPIVGVGTAWMVSSQSMMTALHVLERPLKHYVVVFGYQIINKNGVVNSFIPKSDVYEISSIIKKNEDLDIAEIQLSRPSERLPLEVENVAFNSSHKNEIYMIGYPSGLPMKLALNASVEENEHPFYFYTSLDSFQGNSGSPVFNFFTKKVIGVLVSGEVDYKFNGNCFYSPVCKIPYCKGEKVIRIEQIVKQF